MKASHLFTAFLAALIGVAPVAAAEAAPAEKAKAPAKAAAKAKKAAPKKKAASKRKAPKALTLEEATKIATTPVQAKRHIKRHEQKKAYTAANKGKIKILMLGDSITHQWERASAAPAAKKYLEPYGVLNLGCGGDRTQHTLWIVEKSGILEMINPKLVTLMIGTNHRYNYRATVAGIKSILDAVRKRYPKTPILLYAIFPRGADNKNARRIENEKVNAEIVKFCNNKDIIWVDIRKNFLTPEGILEKSMMPDLLHPRNVKGYTVWGESLKPYFEKYGK